RGFLLKNASLPELLRAIKIVAAGGKYVDASLSAKLAAPDARPVLTRRERDILRLLSNGARYEEAGKSLFVSTATVRKVVSTIKVKFDAATGTEAVATALRLSQIV
ncbi:MAG TPA: LuxR C-terminal-related transcriptional regulator, partial [Thermoanaerobaculia bacterium]|nr:LuxR C-terminal-related transcriptional regulator [Thermoanaerobaculia bacterium]